MSIAARADRFHTLHESGCFLIPNAWDAGSTRLFASLGVAAIATTSAGAAWTLGKRDSAMSKAEALANAAGIVAEAGEIPVSADLEDGFAAAPDEAARIVGEAAAVGLVGLTFEDTTRDPTAPIHDFEVAVARVAAAARAARALPHRFILTARAENFLHGRPDLGDTIRRLVAFAEAGADCLYAPRLPDMEAVRQVVQAVAPKPVNLLLNTAPGMLPLADFAAAGVRRVSLGGMAAAVAYDAALGFTRGLLAGAAPGIAASPSRGINGAMHV
jgi:2-methylisocitrate lyase-like PEP mutase family enzyme